MSQPDQPLTWVQRTARALGVFTLFSWGGRGVAMNLFQRGNFTLSSGAVSGYKIECDALSDADWEALALMVREMVGMFSSVEGVPRGGLKLAERLQPFCRPGCFRHLIVDDVLTTGRSMEVAAHGVNLGNPVIGAVVFARGQCPTWVKALFRMPECLWVAKEVKGE